MASIQTVAGGSVDLPASTTQYATAGTGSLAFSTTEANAQVQWPAGTFSKLQVRIAANDRGATTVRLRKNGVNGNQTVSIGASGTGIFEDASNTDAFSANDLASVSSVTGSGGTTHIVTAVAFLFAATTNTNIRLICAPHKDRTVASATRYAPIMGDVTNDWGTSTRASIEQSFRSAGTIQNGFLYVSANARTNATTFTVEQNSVDSAISMSVGSSATGTFTDTDSFSAASGDEIVWDVTTGSGTQALTVDVLAVEFVTTDSGTEWGNGRHPGASGVTFAAASTSYLPVAGNMQSRTTEAQVQFTVRFAGTTSKLRCYVSSNGLISQTCTIRSRLNSANGGQSLSITTGTGWFEDTTNSDTLASGDTINVSVVVDAGEGSIDLKNILLRSEVAAAAALKDLIGRGITPFLR